MQTLVPWADYRDLFNALGYPKEEPDFWKDIVEPWARAHAGARCAPDEYKELQTSLFPNERPGELYSLYALSRISQILLLPYQADEQQTCTQPTITLSQYVGFFSSLGLTEFTEDRVFNPFFHEIVSVEESSDPGEVPSVSAVLWPGLRFGNMIFSRAGVRVRSGRGRFDKRLAESSTLYFAYRRLRRSCDDTSQGWGHNSRWNTFFHRNYEDERGYHYNVDGEWFIGAECSSPRVRWFPEEDRGAKEQRIEVLRYGCWVTEDGGEAFPFWDRYVEGK